MSLSNLLFSLLPASEPEPETPATASPDDDDSISTSIVHECRTCGTNVSAETTRCPACDGEDIVTYSID